MNTCKTSKHIFALSILDSKRDPAGSATNDNKGKEKAREDYQTHNGRREVTRSKYFFFNITHDFPTKMF